MFTPKLLVEFTELYQQQATTTSFQTLHEFADSQVGRYTDQQMDVICRHMTAFDDDIQCRTTLSNQFAQAFRNFSTQHRFTIFGNPDQVAFQTINGMGCFAVTHAPIVLTTLARSLHSG